MADARLWFRDWNTDLALSGRDLALDDGLESAVIVSLFTDRRADGSDELPAGESDPRGWWGDSTLARGRRIGSRLWLLAREKRSPSVLARAEQYALEALQWLIDDGLARGVSVEVSVAQGDMLALAVTIILPDGSSRQFGY